MKKLLTAKETAQFLRYSDRYFWENYKKLGIPFFKLPTGKILFPTHEIEKWLENNRN